MGQLKSKVFLTPLPLVQGRLLLVLSARRTTFLNSKEMHSPFTNDEEEAGCRIETKQKWLPNLPVSIPLRCRLHPVMTLSKNQESEMRRDQAILSKMHLDRSEMRRVRASLVVS